MMNFQLIPETLSKPYPEGTQLPLPPWGTESCNINVDFSWNFLMKLRR